MSCWRKKQKKTPCICKWRNTNKNCINPVRLLLQWWATWEDYLIGICLHKYSKEIWYIPRLKYTREKTKQATQTSHKGLVHKLNSQNKSRPISIGTDYYSWLCCSSPRIICYCFPYWQFLSSTYLINKKKVKSSFWMSLYTGQGTLAHILQVQKVLLLTPEKMTLFKEKLILLPEGEQKLQRQAFIMAYYSVVCFLVYRLLYVVRKQQIYTLFGKLHIILLTKLWEETKVSSLFETTVPLRLRAMRRKFSALYISSSSGSLLRSLVYVTCRKYWRLQKRLSVTPFLCNYYRK